MSVAPLLSPPPMTSRLPAIALLATLALTALSLSGCIPEEAAPPAQPAESAPDKAPAGGDVRTAPTAGAAVATPPNDSKSLLATVEAMKDQLKDRPRDFNVDAALGNLFYDNGKYIDAIEYYTSALARIAPKTSFEGVAGSLPAGCKLESSDKAADNKAANDKPDGGPGPHPRSAEEAAAFADSIASTNPAGATACLKQLVPALANAYSRRGNSWYLIGNVDKARVDHIAALKLDPNNPDALFFSGAVEMETARGDPAKLAAGKAFWERLLKVAPDHPRSELVRQTLPRANELFGAPARGMPSGGGTASAPALPAGLADSMQKVEHTPEMEAQLDKTTAEAEAMLDKQQWQAALDTLKQVMPLRPSGRTALGMGIALRELGKPTAERVLMQATRLPGGDPPRAKYELAIFYKKSDPAQAKALFQEVADDPKIGPKAKAELALLK